MLMYKETEKKNKSFSRINVPMYKAEHLEIDKMA